MAASPAATAAATTTVSVEEAARRLGVGEATVRRRLHRGGLRGTRRETPQGFTWEVELEELEAAGELPQDAPAADSPPAPAGNAGNAGELVRLEAHNADLRRTVESMQAQLDRQEEELAARRLEVRALLTLVGARRLPAPVDAPVAPGEAIGEAAAPDAAPDGEPRAAPAAAAQPGWWRRLLNRLAIA